jgi:hypothetical protein
VAEIHVDHRQMRTVSEPRDLACLLPTGLFPPLTYLAPEAETVVKVGEISWHVIDVRPQL